MSIQEKRRGFSEPASPENSALTEIFAELEANWKKFVEMVNTLKQEAIGVRQKTKSVLLGDKRGIDGNFQPATGHRYTSFLKPSWGLDPVRQANADLHNLQKITDEPVTIPAFMSDKRLPTNEEQSSYLALLRQFSDQEDFPQLSLLASKCESQVRALVISNQIMSGVDFEKIQVDVNELMSMVKQIVMAYSKLPKDKTFDDRNFITSTIFAVSSTEYLLAACQIDRSRYPEVYKVLFEIAQAASEKFRPVLEAQVQGVESQAMLSVAKNSTGDVVRVNINKYLKVVFPQIGDHPEAIAYGVLAQAHFFDVMTEVKEELGLSEIGYISDPEAILTKYGPALLRGKDYFFNEIFVDKVKMPLSKGEAGILLPNDKGRDGTSASSKEVFKALLAFMNFIWLAGQDDRALAENSGQGNFMLLDKSEKNNIQPLLTHKRTFFNKMEAAALVELSRENFPEVNRVARARQIALAFTTFEIYKDLVMMRPDLQAKPLTAEEKAKKTQEMAAAHAKLMAQMKAAGQLPAIFEVR